MKELFIKYLKKLQKLQRDYSDKFIITIDSFMPNSSSNCNWYSLSISVQDENFKIIASDEYLFTSPNYKSIKNKHKEICQKLMTAYTSSQTIS